MSNEDGWDDIVPELHDDGKGFSISFALRHGEAGLAFGGDFYFRYPTEGLPPIDIEELRNEVVGAVMWLGHMVFPNEIPEFAAEDDDAEAAA